MSTMITEVYDAFRAAGTPEPEARKAAEALSSAEPRFDALDRKIERLEAKVELRFAETDRKIDRLEAKIDRLDTKFTGEMSLMKWMLGFLLAFVVANTAKLFLH